MDTLKALRVAETVLRSGSDSSAARQLGVRAAAVSKFMAELEAQLGLRLFDRSTRSLKPTEECRRLLERVGPALQEIDDALIDGTPASAPRGVVKVSVSGPFARMTLLPGLPAFHAAHPDIVLDLRIENRRVELITEGYDCAIGVAPPADSTLVARPLARLRPAICAAPAYLATHGVPQHPGDLGRHRCIGLRSETTGVLREWPLQLGDEQFTLRPAGGPQVNDPATAAAAAEAGCGVVFVGVHHVAEAIGAGRLVRLLPEVQTQPFELVIYYAKRRLLPPRTRALVDHVLATVPQAPVLQLCRDLMP
jgi:DNA-binding transcriptional LysR family regulator